MNYQNESKNKLTPNGLITISTDFGLSDPYVGIMKSVMYSKNQNLRFIDLNHFIEPQNLLHAALSLEASINYSPKGTTHLVVVDPGVGTECKRIICRNSMYYFVFPDNGLLDLIFKKNPIIESYEIIKKDNKNVSSTFHGRDLFAPAAADIASGKKLSDIGQKTQIRTNKLKLPTPRLNGNIIDSVKSIYTDRFGNIFTNIKKDFIKIEKYTKIKLHGKYFKICKTYSDVKVNELGILLNSFGYYEIFKRNNNASKCIKLNNDVIEFI